MHGPLPLELQAQRAIELQGGGEQHRGRDRLAESVANDCRILPMLEQRAPRGVQVDDVPANRIVLEQESVQAIAIVHDRGFGQVTGRRMMVLIRRYISPPAVFQQAGLIRNSPLACQFLLQQIIDLRRRWALPPVTLITWPTKKPNSLSLPER